MRNTNTDPQLDPNKQKPTRRKTAVIAVSLASLGLAAGCTTSHDTPAKAPIEAESLTEHERLVQGVDNLWASLVQEAQVVVDKGNRSHTEVRVGQSDSTYQDQRFMSTDSATQLSVNVNVPQPDGEYTQYSINATVPNVPKADKQAVDSQPEATWGSAITISARTVYELNGGTGPANSSYRLQLGKAENGEWYIRSPLNNAMADETAYETGPRPLNPIIMDDDSFSSLPIIDHGTIDQISERAHQLLQSAAEEAVDY